MKIFLTGATGYIGGEVLHCIATSVNLKCSISCLVRDAAKASTLQETFPEIRVVLGDLDDVSLVEKEAKGADVVLHMASTNHVGSSRAIARGLDDTKPDNKGREAAACWIQISGASLFAAAEIRDGKYGQGSDIVRDDVEDLDDIVTLIKASPSRVVDNLVLSQKSDKIKTALVVGTLIYGTGNGPFNRRSIQAPEVARNTLLRKKGFYVGAGLSAWSNIHIHDLGVLFLKLVETAASNSSEWKSPAIFLPENGEMTFGDLSRSIATAACTEGSIPTPDCEEISPEEADSMMPHGAVLWATNARVKGTRARTELGWQPSAASLAAEIPAIVQDEAHRLLL